jgi:class 3 adenylate cyclase
MSEVRDWLETIGLAQYADAFEANEIDRDLLGQVDDQILKDIGVSPAGHRLRIRNAIAKMGPVVTPDAKATAAPNAPEIPTASAERRQLTVMFCDLVGSTALSARLDPEDLRGIIGSYHRCCTDLIERNGGFVAKYMGDGVLAYFGYPQAHEHDAERAVRTGLALVEAVPKLKTAVAVPLQVRVGIATGVVVVGDLIGSGEAQERGIVGETPNLAARLQAVALADTVVIAEGTRKLLGNLFELNDLGSQQLKGLAAPTQAFAVVRPSSIESRFEALHAAALTTLVGRDEEIELLMRRWEQVKSGQGRVVVLTGEPGIGKSRITVALQECVKSDPHTRLRHFCSPHHQDSALHPVISQLEKAAGLAREDTAEEKLAKLEALLAQSNAQPDEIGFIAELLSIPNGGRYPLPELSPPKRKERTLTALLAQWKRLAARQPVLAVYEDVHWIDPTTLELLTLMIEGAQHLPVLLLITARPEFKQSWPAYEHVTDMTLRRMGRGEGASLIGQVTGGKSLPKVVVDRIIDRTDGVPLFIEELTKTVIESGMLTDAGDRYTLAGPLRQLAIPATLHASLIERLDRLGPAKEVAQIRATIGREFSYELLAAVADRTDTAIRTALARKSHRTNARLGG